VKLINKKNYILQTGEIGRKKNHVLQTGEIDQ